MNKSLYVCSFTLVSVFMTLALPGFVSATESQRYSTIDEVPLSLRQRLDYLNAAKNRKFTPLDGIIERFSVDNANVPEAVAKLSNNHNVLCGIEVVPWPFDSGKPDSIILPRISLSVERATPRQILDKLVLLDPTFVWTEDNGFANLVIHSALRSTTYPLNARITEFKVQDRPYTMALLSAQTPSLFQTPQVTDRLGLGMSGRWPREFEPKVSIDTRGVTAREIINQVGRQVGMSWVALWQGCQQDVHHTSFSMLPKIEITGRFQSKPEE